MPVAHDVVRDPLWDNIRLEPAALAALDTPEMQRLRYVRQLGHAFLVYPGASHSRLEHALGAYHLARRALAQLEERGELDGIPEADRLAVRLAALLHDVGHYPFSHALEEAGFPDHEELGRRKLVSGALGAVLAGLGDGLGATIGALVTGTSTAPLAGLISGSSLDLDKLDYLSRDARMCGVPYGAVDVDRLLAALTIVGEGDSREVGVGEKGLSALESLLFAKYQMYRNVYWHHAVRSATCMFKRCVRAAVRAGTTSTAQLAEATDDGLMEVLARGGQPLAVALRERRLHKRVVDLSATEVTEALAALAPPEADAAEAIEDAVAARLGLAPGELLIDYPRRDSMLAVDLPLRLRDGRVERLTAEGRAGTLGLPRVAGELYTSARRLRVFVARGRALEPARVLAALAAA
ncbi:MAG: HD domain-containing protein [Gemmatimonadales bacterium]|nr:HD domain-containing protein [Gemmatimonadales bacterium]